MKRWLRRVVRVALAAFVLLSLIIVVEICVGWRCHLQGDVHAPVVSPPERKAITAGIPGYVRSEDNTLLSYPEWYIVWSYQEKADYQATHLPGGFPYFGAVQQYWSSYCCISRLIRGKYPFNGGEQLMLVVIGTSFSAEYILKGLYEKSIGRISEWSSGGKATEEDRFAYQVASEYADFVHVRPFYEFHFARQVPALWRSTPLFGAHFVRKLERKFFLTADYTIEAFYCWVIEKLTHLTYGSEPNTTYAWIEGDIPTAPTEFSLLKIVKQAGPAAFVVALPRYQAFTPAASDLGRQGARFVEIAGNSQILLSVLSAQGWHYANNNAQILFSIPILTDSTKQRVVLRCDALALTAVLDSMPSSGANLEHIYDY